MKKQALGLWIKLLIDEQLGRSGFMTVLFFRVVPLVPYEVINYASGLPKISFKDYFLSRSSGSFPVLSSRLSSAAAWERCVLGMIF